jgi:hypothetical protein
MAPVAEEQAEESIDRARIERGIREGMINWMEFAARRSWQLL